MSRSNMGVIPDRPNRPLVVRCAYEGSSRRVNFPSAATCRLDSLRSRVEECFSLSASPFSLTYKDDDGEEFTIRSDSDLTEAISYFISGDDEAPPSFSNGSIHYGVPAQKISLRLDVVVEYDGPSLSDTSSISSFRTGGSGSDGTSWRSSSGYDYGESHRYSGSGYSTVQHPVEEDELTQYGEGSRRRSVVESLGRLDLENSLSGSTTPRRQSGQAEREPSPSRPPHPLTGPESESAPSLLTHSELGSRWLREQSRLAARKLGPASSRAGTGGRSARYESDEESLASDEERPGDIALVRDASGRYYYSYQTDTSSRSSQSAASYDDYRNHGNRPISHSVSSHSTDSAISPPATLRLTDHPHEMVRIAEPTGPPIFAPDCSACGVRLDYMRYVCRICGEGEMWEENASGKASFVSRSVSGESDLSDESSEATEWGVPPPASLATVNPFDSRTIYEASNSRSRGASSTLIDTSYASTQNTGSSSSPTTATYRYGLDPTPPQSPNGSSENVPRGNVGYELCAGCIEVHGIAHSKAAARLARSVSSRTGRATESQPGNSRHAFREKIWGAEGWVDVGVSCSKFDLCHSCYDKVEEIHPAHAFLSLPDRPLPRVGLLASNGQGGRNGHVASDGGAPNLVRHPGAFCHNCLKDIVGPRFHCAVCPSWDLCIQCEGLHTTAIDGSGHLPDHIMMKIPVPLPSSEIEAVSRRARDRWFHQDRGVAVASSETPLSRSSSPTNDTVYAPTAPALRDAGTPTPSRINGITTSTRDVLDHGMRCVNCNEWIMGKRYQCANCPSNPDGYNLCSICELRSYRIHNPLHVFLKFDRPVHVPLISSQPILPILYRQPVGKIPSSALATINPRDPTSYLGYVIHKETLCDVHGDQIRGVWLRCAHCAEGFDICQEAEERARHDPKHVFIVFKARVDMAAFRAVADLGATHSKPLLKQQVYIS
nr:uncharacterized protein CI109_002233 [Kwoniella shandongensis]KAA5529340.1 hypothetical protein CI109_002233 [Kwoniella shandongensis]